MLNRFWRRYLHPMVQRPPVVQVAALCYRVKKGRLQILMVTSLNSKRWILPKGWVKDTIGAAKSAAEEAWEEAGVRPSSRPLVRIGQYRYEKLQRGGIPVPADVDVFAIEVGSLEDAFPEAKRRKRRWMDLDEAVNAVDEPELKAMLSGIAEDSRDLVWAAQ